MVEVGFLVEVTATSTSPKRGMYDDDSSGTMCGGYGRSTIYAKLRGDSAVSQDVAERITALLRQRRDDIDAVIEKIAR